MELNELVKNTIAYKIFDKDILSGNFSHAYMFVSLDSLFLEKFQKIILKRIFCLSNKRPCLNCGECKRIENNTHPDVIIYPKSGKKINVDEVSILNDEIYLKPVERDFKVLVLNNAEEINPQAQNKLLKTLEEPPKNTHLLLFCKNKFNVFNTILSRVKLLEIMPFTSEEIYGAFKDEILDLNLLKVAAFSSFGSLKRAQEIIEDKDFKNVLNFCYFLCLKINEPKDLATVLNDFNLYKEKFLDILSILQLIFRDCIMIKNGKIESITQTEKIVDLKKIEKMFSEKALIYLIEAVNKCNYKLKFNCNNQAVFDILCLDIIKAKQNKFKSRELQNIDG